MRASIVGDWGVYHKDLIYSVLDGYLSDLESVAFVGQSDMSIIYQQWAIRRNKDYWMSQFALDERKSEFEWIVKTTEPDILIVFNDGTNRVGRFMREALVNQVEVHDYDRTGKATVRKPVERNATDPTPSESLVFDLDKNELVYTPPQMNSLLPAVGSLVYPGPSGKVTTDSLRVDGTQGQPIGRVVSIGTGVEHGTVNVAPMDSSSLWLTHRDPKLKGPAIFNFRY